MPEKYSPNTKDLTREGCIVYLENWIGILQEKIHEDSVQAPLYKEQIDFLTKTVEELKSIDKK